MRSHSSRAVTGRSRSAFAWCALAGVALLAAPAGAQVVPPGQIAPTPAAPERAVIELLKAGRDPLANAFFTPEAVMRHQQAIGLTADQRAGIVAAISEAQPRFVEAQWSLEPETAALSTLLGGPQVDEQAVLAQIDRVLDIERQIKRIQVEMLVRIKNQLTAEQQSQLTRLGGARGLGLGSLRPKLAPWGYIGGDLNRYIGGSNFLEGDVLNYHLGGRDFGGGVLDYPVVGVPWGG
jgi:Spy/CpxP family protein refolding chaperone